MPSRLPQHIVGFMRRGETGGNPAHLDHFGLAEWQRALPWLDSSGLALHFLHKLETLDAESVLPCSVRARLQRNFADNAQRNAALAEEMRAIHAHFEARTVNFAVLKGYSLIPEYCSMPALRHQCDLDYLVAQDHLSSATHGLRALGYVRVRKSPGTFTFSRSIGHLPGRGEIYKPGLNVSVELHTSLWDNNDVAVLESLPQVLARRRMHQACGLVFPALAREDLFIHQCMHVLSHILQFWIRLSWLYEIATFLSAARTDSRFWRAVDGRIGDASYIARAVGFVASLAAEVFGGEPLPAWSDIPDPLRLWVSQYGLPWAMHDLPGSKLSLFIFREFMNEEQWRDLARRRLFPFHRPHSATQVSDLHPRRSLRAHFAESRYAGQRFIFHCREAWHYFRERPRWRRLLARSESMSRESLEAVLR